MWNKTQHKVALCVTCLLTLSSFASENYAPANDSITAEDLRRDVFFLTSDEINGRLVGSQGNLLATEYIEQRFSKLGIKAFTTIGSYRQTFNLLTATMGKGNALRIQHVEGDPPLHGLTNTGKLGRDFYPERFSGTGHAEGELVFIGFGISAPHLNYDDYQNTNIKGKVVLALDHEPGEFESNNIFNGLIASEHGRALRKALEAQRRGATAILFVSDIHNHSISQTLNSAIQRIWPTEESRVVPTYQLETWVRELHIPAVRISPELAEQLAQNSGYELHSLAERAETVSGITPIEFSKIVVEVETFVERNTALQTHNVVGMIEGIDPVLKNEWIILCAHYDHEGEAETGFFPGADDNASGISGMLEIAEAYTLAGQQGYHPKRSVIFAAWNAEERGLLGSWAYTKQPLVPLDKTITVINLDMIGRNEEIPPDGGRRFGWLEPQTAESNLNAVNLLGYSYSTDLRNAAEEANEAIGLMLRFRYDHNRINLLRRSDHWPFLFNNIPALFIHTGLHPDYHTQEDLPEKLNYNKMVKVVQLAHQLSWDLTHKKTRPLLD